MIKSYIQVVNGISAGGYCQWQSLDWERLGSDGGKTEDYSGQTADCIGGADGRRIALLYGDTKSSHYSM